ncbi:MULTISPECIES: hypothetical protein [Bacillaceae]|jgi:hypothetical protein|uniref:Uncharacterized protein n=1 Tax=Ornithinibacillus halotolerans TaxID=1274357 RepID=A0A916S032_9BACI|nr:MULTISPECIES: hypothetical protein [Bacillaceae]GGA75355.1 hypothetical protein GCM10008025_18800 [Ornithinibacillus halotolerans]
MKFGNYKIDSFWLIMIVGVLIVSIFTPMFLFAALLLLIVGIKKEK